MHLSLITILGLQFGASAILATKQSLTRDYKARSGIVWFHDWAGIQAGLVQKCSGNPGDEIIKRQKMDARRVGIA
jgi:hypothetical protein